MKKITVKFDDSIVQLIDKKLQQTGMTYSQYIRQLVVSDLNSVKDTRNSDGYAQWGREPEGFVL